MARAIGIFPRTSIRTRWRTDWPVLTEWLYLTIIAIQFLLLVNPWDVNFRFVGFTKHFGLLATVPLLAVHFAGRRIFAPMGAPDVLPSVVYQTWPFMLLATMVIAGSLYAREAEDISNNFLSLGMYLPFVALAAAVVAATQAPRKLLQLYFLIWGIAGLGMIALVFANNRPFHEEVPLLVALPFFFALQPRLGRFRWVVIAAILAAVIWTRKNTAYLTLVTALAYYLAVIWLPVRIKTHRVNAGFGAFLKIYGFAAIAAIGVAAITFLIMHRDQYLPSGNIEYRTHMYTLAWRKFLSSPIFGSFFSESSSILFTRYQVATTTQVLPVHSDVLDVLAHGGVLGILLWVVGYLRAASFAFRELLRPSRLTSIWAPYAHTLAVASIAAVVVSSFNPVMTAVPNLAYMVWTNLGLLIGLAIWANRERLSPESAHGA